MLGTRWQGHTSTACWGALALECQPPACSPLYKYNKKKSKKTLWSWHMLFWVILKRFTFGTSFLPFWGACNKNNKKESKKPCGLGTYFFGLFQKVRIWHIIFENILCHFVELVIKIIKKKVKNPVVLAHAFLGYFQKVRIWHIIFENIYLFQDTDSKLPGTMYSWIWNRYPAIWNLLRKIMCQNLWVC